MGDRGGWWWWVLVLLVKEIQYKTWRLLGRMYIFLFIFRICVEHGTLFRIFNRTLELPPKTTFVPYIFYTDNMRTNMSIAERSKRAVGGVWTFEFNI